MTESQIHCLITFFSHHTFFFVFLLFPLPPFLSRFAIFFYHHLFDSSQQPPSYLLGVIKSSCRYCKPYQKESCDLESQKNHLCQTTLRYCNRILDWLFLYSRLSLTEHHQCYCPMKYFRKYAVSVFQGRQRQHRMLGWGIPRVWTCRTVAWRVAHEAVHNNNTAPFSLTRECDKDFCIAFIKPRHSS